MPSAGVDTSVTPAPRQFHATLTDYDVVVFGGQIFQLWSSMIRLHPSLSIYSSGSPASPHAVARLAAGYPLAPQAYLDVLRQATDVVLLWNRWSELRI